MRIVLVLPLATFSLSALAVRFDPPDLKFEQELHRQFLKQAGVHSVPWEGRDAYIENYRLQKGETLWSLSETLYGDGHFWPRVWAQNQGITNPHLIRPGHTLQFMLGSEDSTPSFRFSEEDEGGVELAQSANQNPLIEIPPPEIPPKKVIKIPLSFPSWQSVYKQLPVRITDDKGLLRQRRPLVGKTYLTAYVQETQLESSGKFLETDLDSALPTVNQYVYVQVKRGEGRVGQHFLVVRDMGRLRKQNKVVEMPEAYLIQVAAELELTEPATSTEANEEYETYRALIVKATGLSLRHFDLTPGEMQEVILNYEGAPGVAEAQIIGNGKSVAADLFAPGDIVFLNKGSDAGLAAGQILDVYQDRTLRKLNTEVRFSPAPSGTVRIVRVTAGLATAVILGARDGLLPGDKVQKVTSRSAEREVLEHKESGLGLGADEGDIEGDIDAEDSDFGDEGGSSSDSDEDFEL